MAPCHASAMTAGLGLSALTTSRPTVIGQKRVHARRSAELLLGQVIVPARTMPMGQSEMLLIVRAGG